MNPVSPLADVNSLLTVLDSRTNPVSPVADVNFLLYWTVE